MDKQRRKLLQSSAILGIASSMISLSGALGLQGCDSNQSKMPSKIQTQKAQRRELAAQIQHNTQTQKEVTMEFITFSLLIKGYDEERL